MLRVVLAAVFSLTLAAQLVVGQSAWADGGDFSLDFVAAAPLTYNHLSGGGAYDDRTIGRDKDVVESLEGGDFACGDLVTFLTQIVVDSGASSAQTIELDYEFTAHSTGQQGVSLGDIVNQMVNYGAVSGGDGPGGTDSGIADNANSVATLVVGSEVLTGTEFVKPSLLKGTLNVTNLEAGEKVVVRVDVRINCNGETPTGNMQARLAAARVTSPADDTINTGDQTIPFKHVGAIKPPPCDPKDPTCKP